ncbi:50S ribosomal protein L29 [Candidatus Kaiserbacteria bacterium CG10_big_fil_rev_8_21_14_0_10_49_17]|uniref:Large ribosomal subunit protein uL29 n=1 Tax=Candidatus Kaiserbacteria bacterium CG10_big_fil_rev_8_21_14_0_10_49_17 TaxID=1974609 RepID=A0A2M6WEI9_9BACT|nr:MAG: 50S ribosomal protein L29 [Candidatus Kaiserbacteria bacterium CG10_big_fil_rev_8_21_14_0_10_49_17]
MKDLRKKSDADLAKLLVQNQEAHRGFRFTVAGSSARNTREGRALRKSIARIKTLMNERKQK